MNKEEIVIASKKAFDAIQSKSSLERAALLRDIAQEIESMGEDLLKMASVESNLPIVRFEGERARTCHQLRMFADLIQNEDWRHVSTEEALPDRKPLPRPSMEMYNIPIGVILVFGASNFPLAYSTAGGDTASALAAGCSVIYKAHPAHIRTSRMVAEAIAKAISKNDFDPHTFIHYEAESNEDVRWVVMQDNIQGVGFTGSKGGGLAILEYAKNRKQPIPVFAEMGSVNPVVLLSDALHKKSEYWAQAYAGAITQGVGQFCTNPGILLAVKSEALDNFVASISTQISAIKDFVMLNEGIYNNYEKRRQEVLGMECIYIQASGLQSQAMSGIATLTKVNGKNYIKNPTLHEEVFGPFSLIIECDDFKEMKFILQNFEGQLTSSIIAEEGDKSMAREVLEILKYKAGRIILNGVPTGVEVCNSMVHGGPFPSTTDARFTSVGIKAIDRWLRPVCYQNFTDDYKNLF